MASLQKSGTWFSKPLLWTGLFVWLTLLVASRFYQLKLIPATFSDDQFVYVINAQSIRETGRDITGLWSPFSLTPIEPIYDELTAVIMSWAFFLPIDTMLAARLTHALMSLSLPFIIGGLAWQVTQSKKTAVITAFLASWNPWIWQMGRLTFDSLPGFFFILLGTWVMGYLKSWRKLASLPLFWLGFYQYQGFKVLLLIWVLAWVGYAVLPKMSFRQLKDKQVMPLLVVALACLAQLLYYSFVQLPNQKSLDRLDSINLPNAEVIRTISEDTQKVNLVTPINKVFLNKYVTWISYSTKQYFNTLNPSFLFLRADNAGTALVVWDYGVFHVMDLVLIVCGIVYLFKTKKAPQLVLLLGLLFVVAPIPNMLRTDNWPLFRMAFSLPPMLILAALGVGQIFEWLRQYRLGKVAIVIFVGVYLCQIAYFTFVLFNAFPLYTANKTYFTNYQMQQYLKRVPANVPVTVYTSYPRNLMKIYVWEHGLLQTDPAKVHKIFQTSEFQFDNVTFTEECLPTIATESGVTIVENSHKLCPDVTLPVLPNLSIVDPNDSGEVFSIYGDPVCQNLRLPTYLRITQLEQFDWNQMGNQHFCRTWVSNFEQL